jgi:hypothetical protein
MQKIKSFSYGFNERTIVLFVEVINKLCQIIANLDSKHLFSQILNN